MTVWSARGVVAETTSAANPDAHCEPGRTSFAPLELAHLNWMLNLEVLAESERLAASQEPELEDRGRPSTRRIASARLPLRSSGVSWKMSTLGSITSVIETSLTWG